MTSFRFGSFPFTPSVAVVLSLLLAGCSGDTTTSAQFAPSSTAPTAGLVKLEQKSNSGSQLVVDVLIYGPEPDLDLAAFEFGIDIGDEDLVRLVPQSTYRQTALVSDPGQAVAIDVDDSDPSLVAIVVEKQGGGSGNGFTAESRVVIELTFEVQGSGTSPLSLVGLGGNPPRALDSSRAAIGAVRFDRERAAVSVETSSNGY